MLLWLLAFPLPAQILVGPTAGLNYSWTSFDDKDLKDIYDVSPVIGFHAGATVSFRVRNKFFLNTSLLYSTKGRKVKNNFDRLYNHEVRYNYIEMPIIYTFEFKGTVSSGKQYKWYFGAGPNVSYWLGGKGTLSNSDLDEGNVSALHYHVVFDKDPELIRPHEMIVQDPNRIQLGLNIAAGFVFEPLGYQKIMLMVRYELGHSFMSRTGNGMFYNIAYQDEMKVRNQGFRVSLSYLVDLKVEERKKGKSTIKKKRL